jgi:hypothetical protein
MKIFGKERKMSVTAESARLRAENRDRESGRIHPIRFSL